MANPWASEVAIPLDGVVLRAKLTLGALAELEARLGEESLIALVERFESGRFQSRDVLALIAAGLRGGGWQGEEKDLYACDIAGGPLQAAQLAAQLLMRAFSMPGQA